MIPTQVKGKPYKIDNPFVGKIEINNSDTESLYVLNFEKDQKLILSLKPYKDKTINGIYNLHINHLTPGDIVVILPNGIVNTLFRVKSEDNTLFMTNMCNQNCIMCSQPPQKNNDIKELFKINSSLLDFIPFDTRQIGISGGEPTLCGQYLGLLLTKLFFKASQINVCILTNAVLFSNAKFLEILHGLPKGQILFSIPIYSDNYIDHDLIVRSKNAFYNTIKGIHNLSTYGYRVELRIIPQKKNISRLEKLSHFIFKNLTFVENVAFMGIENIGHARKNITDVWVTPEELSGPLKKAINFLRISGISCSLYNYQKCILDESLRELSLSTISDWKVEYLPLCTLCSGRKTCGGIFYSSLDLIKEYITPII